jgi:hypothetical protein
MATMGSIGAGIWLSARGGGADKKTEQGPPIAASSKDEEQFITYVPRSVLFCLFCPWLVCWSGNVCAQTDSSRDFLKNVEGGGEKKEAKH